MFFLCLVAKARWASKGLWSVLGFHAPMVTSRLLVRDWLLAWGKIGAGNPATGTGETTGETWTGEQESGISIWYLNLVLIIQYKTSASYGSPSVRTPEHPAEMHSVEGQLETMTKYLLVIQNGKTLSKWQPHTKHCINSQAILWQLKCGA